MKKEDLFNGYAPFDGEWMVEEFVENVKELAIIVAVDTHGGEITYPSIDMYFNPESNLVEFLYSPSALNTEILKQAEQIAKQAVMCLNSPGLFAVELFITAENEIWVNEMAPRPHNSGHHTIEGCITSQFAQLNRILLGERVGSTELIKPSAMINVVGPEGWEGSYQLADKEMWDASGDVFVHLYNKSVSKPHRKLGHVTVVSDDADSLIRRAREVQKELRIIPS
jgi:5-(carboxyamino)imidazole ribonucleotide synthase